MTSIPAVLAFVLIALFVAPVIVFVVTSYGQTIYAATRRWKAINRAERRRKTCRICGEPGTVWRTTTTPGWVGKEPPGWLFCANHADRGDGSLAG